MNLHNGIKENRTRWYKIICVIALWILVFLKSNFWQGFASAILIAGILYFLVILFLLIKKYAKRDFDK